MNPIKDWLKPGNNGYTPLHYAAMGGQLDQVPVEILTKENMLVPGNDGDTPLQQAAIKGQLDQVPVEILTKENMLVPDSNGNTPLQCAAIKGQLDQVPISTLAELQKSGHLADYDTGSMGKKIVDYLTSHEPYDPFDL